ncbi:glucose 1-dehydrogenase [Aureimonas fodinaquatilis]|uniref:Glucose 1-dehydrogenase n=1 Tax=Aureimonas fodinaquatilis TaxID=2565783 RepID=A0A5B0DUB7_9HYPH|nr:glucose 1-dehydrogenase [Aureimonas fodinaquatilis]KAA0970364.1 glucose 1-dehydrogenase [Aureimonas fodinaquatilis]
MSLSQTFGLSGRNAVVTGGARGLGSSIAKALFEAGARVAIIDKATPSESLLEQLSSGDGKPLFVSADLAERASVEAAGETILESFAGEVDILVNNAGIQHRAGALDQSFEQWQEVISVNLTAAFLLSQRFGKGMAARGRGKIINLASIRSTVGSHGAIAYGTSKGGLAQLTRSLSNDLAPHGVQVNAIAPGFMRTDMTSSLQADQVQAAEALLRIPSGRWGEPDDLAGLAVFLASGASDYVTGAIIPCDGGFLAA